MAHDKIVITPAEAKELREKLSSLNESACKTQLLLAELLTKVYYGVVKQANGQETDLVSVWGFDDFDAFAETSIRDGGLEMHEGTARAHVLLYEELFMGRWKFHQDTLPMSITKLKRLATVSKKVTEERTMLSWVGKAHKMTCCEFDAAVDDAFGTGNKLRSFRFGLKPTHYASFMKKLTLAREVLGGESKAETMLKVLEDFTSRQEASTRRKSA